MKVTIRTTTYNREKLLPRTIQSVLSQSFTDFEYVIVNNGSTDGTQSIIEEYRNKDDRIRSFYFTVNNRDSDVWKERNIEKQYNAPYYLNIDDDDFMESTAVETLYRLITEYEADIASVGSKYIYPDGSMKDKFVFNGFFNYNRIEAMTELLKREKFNAASGGKLFKTELLINNDIPSVAVARDIYTRYRMLNKINRMVVSGEPLFYFYRHDHNQSGLDTAEQITPEKLRQHLEANTMRTQWLTENMPEIKDFVFYCELSFMISLYERIYRLEIKDCYMIVEEMKASLLSHNNYLSECGFCTEKEKEIIKNIF